MSDSVLRKQLIRLAHERPEFREHILPLLQKSAASAFYPLADVRGQFGSFQSPSDDTDGFGFEIMMVGGEAADAHSYFPKGKHVVMVDWDGNTLQVKFDL